MAVNLSELANVEPFVPDLSMLQGDVVSNLKSNGIEQAAGWLGFGILLAILAFLTWHYYRKDGKLLFDITRAGTIAAGFTTIFGLVAVSLGFIGSYIYVVWHGTFFLLFLAATIRLKIKGL